MHSQTKEMNVREAVRQTALPGVKTTEQVVHGTAIKMTECTAQGAAISTSQRHEWAHTRDGHRNQ